MSLIIKLKNEPFNDRDIIEKDNFNKVMGEISQIDINIKILIVIVNKF